MVQNVSFKYSDDTVRYHTAVWDALIFLSNVGRKARANLGTEEMLMTCICFVVLNDEYHPILQCFFLDP